MLARREHARRELARKLTQKGFSETAVRQALDALEAEGLLSDARFAEALVRSRTERGYGPLRIRAELIERGVDPALIEAQLEAELQSWVELARRQQAKRFGQGPAQDYRERARRARFLEGRGFPAEVIRRVLND